MSNRPTSKGTPWTTSKVDNLFYQLRTLRSCIEKLTSALVANTDTSPSPTQSSVVTGSIDDQEVLSAGLYTESQHMRSVEVQASATSGTLEILITKTDGSIVSFNTFVSSVTSWSYEGLLTEAPISSVTVKNITAAAGAIDIIINVVSRS